MIPGIRRAKPQSPLPENWRPPVFEPVEDGPKGTWYKALPNGGVEAGARIPRGIRFVTAWFSTFIFPGWAVFEFIAAEEPIEYWWIMLLILAVPTGIALGFALYLTGAVRIQVQDGIVLMERGVWIFKRRRRVPIAKVEKVRLIPRSTTYTYVSDDDYSRAMVDMSVGSGLTMAFALATKEEEIEIASDLNLVRTFYLRYVLVKAIQEAKQAAAKGKISAASAD